MNGSYQQHITLDIHHKEDLMAKKKQNVIGPTTNRLEQVVKLKIADIRISEDNPNQMSDFEFSQLKKSIKEEGFDEPIKVVPDPQFEGEDGKYLVISGSHRLRACDELGWQEIPSIIEKDWDETKANAYLVSRNLNRGHIDSRKLRNLVETRFGGFTHEQIAEMFGMENESQLKRLAKIREESKFDEEAIQNQINESESEMVMIDGLHGMLSAIFAEYGTDVEKNFIAFMVNRKLQLLALMPESSTPKIEKFVKYCRENELDMGAALDSMLDQYLENTEGDPTEEN